MRLLDCFLDLLNDWTGLFPQRRSYLHAVRQAIGTLLCLGRHTISRIIWANGDQHRPWQATYFFYGRTRWDPPRLFSTLLKRALPHCPGRYIGVAVDDTRLRKTGPCIQQAFFQRDPLSPHFHMNLMFGLRFLQASLLIPLYRRSPVGTRALPIHFEEVSVVKRPRRLPQPKARKRKPSPQKASRKSSPHSQRKLAELKLEWQRYRAAVKLYNLSRRFVGLMHHLRAAFDAAGAGGRTLLLAVDGSFCNKTVFTTVVEGVELIARARKNIVLCFRAVAGSRRFYDPRKFTPEQIRQDASIPWRTTKVFYGGKRRQVQYKEVPMVYWQGGARQRPLRLLVVRPTRYQKAQSGRYYYRQPAYLLTTVLHDTVRQLLQIYFDRWQIEVNHREEKDTLGVGQAQLRNVTAVPKQPAFAVAVYSALLLAALLAFGPERGPAYAPLPKWRRRARRPSALDLITLLRKEATESPDVLARFKLHPTDRRLTAAAAA